MRTLGLRSNAQVISKPAVCFRAFLHIPMTWLQCATSTANGRKAEEVRNCSTDEGGAPRNRLAGAGSKPPSAALSKRQGRERGRKRPGITGSGDRQEEDRKGTTAEVSKRYR
jgi:hypothetical protein